MAQVDFSNVNITCVGNIWGEDWLTLPTFKAIYEKNGSGVARNSQNEMVNVTPTHFTYKYTGEFTRSLTNATLVLCDDWGNNVKFELSPVTFNAGDTYAFQIDADIVIE